MESVKEMWNLVFGWFGNGKKMIAGGLFLLVGMIAQSFSTKTLEQIPFILMAAGLMCFVNALFSKISGHNINILLYLVINVAVVEIGLSLTSYNLFGDSVDSMTMAVIWILCILAVWILQSLLLPVTGMSKRLSLAFFETVLSAVAVLADFVIPIMLSVFF